MRNEVLNIEYYQTLAARPNHCKDKYCVGTMDGGSPTHHWNVRPELFETYWPQPEPWITKHRRLMWNHLVERGPVCDPEDEDYRGNDNSIFQNLFFSKNVTEVLLFSMYDIYLNKSTS